MRRRLLVSLHGKMRIRVRLGSSRARHDRRYRTQRLEAKRCDKRDDQDHHRVYRKIQIIFSRHLQLAAPCRLGRFQIRRSGLRSES